MEEPKQTTIFYTCFNGHDVAWGITTCPVCGATAYPKTEEPVKEEMDKPVDATEQALVILENRNQILLKWLSNIQITNKEERINCSDMLTNARQAYKEANVLRMELSEPSRKEIDRIDKIFKPFLDKINTGINAITKAMGSWDSEQERLAKEALQSATVEELNQDTGEIIQVVTQPVDMPQKTTHSHVGSDTRREGFDIVITNPDLVPRQYCEPSMVKLRAGFKLTDTIPGAQKIKKTIYQTRVSK